MMNKACFILMVAMSPATLFAGETMVTETTRPTTNCDFRLDKCETTVATDPSYVRFKDGTPGLAPVGTGTAVSASSYQSSFNFVDYSAPLQPPTEDLADLIQSKLSNCPEVTVKYDDYSGEISVHYLKPTSKCDCDWALNVRDVKADDFVWVRTSDNYSPYLGQMERRKFHCDSQQDAQKIELACELVCKNNAWAMDR